MNAKQEMVYSMKIEGGIVKLQYSAGYFKRGIKKIIQEVKPFKKNDGLECRKITSEQFKQLYNLN